MPLRIAFAGPDRGLCSALAERARDLLDRPPLLEVAVPQGEVHPDWLHLRAAVVRRMRLEEVRGEPIVVGSSCGLDEVAAQAAHLAGEVARASGGLALIDGRGHPIPDQRQALINRAGAVLQVLLNSAEEEIVDYWTHVYAAVPAAAAADGSLPSQYLDFLRAVPAFQKVARLPFDAGLAVDALEAEARAWRTEPLSGP